jgi:hypothetical protein
MSALGDYARRCGLAFDQAINVLTGGAVGQTVSLRAAIAQRDGQRWGCWLCWILARVVQPNHCHLQFTDAVETGAVYARAMAAFDLAFAAVGPMGYAAARLIGAWA